jgi:hypothetical protein
MIRATILFAADPTDTGKVNNCSRDRVCAGSKPPRDKMLSRIHFGKLVRRLRAAA